MQPVFTRGFRLHHNGQVLDGAEFPSGRTFVIDDPEFGLATVATSLEELLKGYHGARVERPDGQPVPTALLLDLVNIAAQAADSDDVRRADVARAVLGPVSYTQRDSSWPAH